MSSLPEVVTLRHRAAGAAGERPVIGRVAEALFYLVMVGLFVTATVLFFGLTLLVPQARV